MSRIDFNKVVKTNSYNIYTLKIFKRMLIVIRVNL